MADLFERIENRDFDDERQHAETFTRDYSIARQSPPEARQCVAAVQATIDPCAAKMMQCLRYQCAEGDIPEEPLFKALASAIAAECESYVNGLDEYDACPWG
jgi:hypothetical protein